MINAAIWFKRYIVLVGMILFLFGCTLAGGHRYDYRAPLTIKCTGSSTISIAVHDVRKYIVNGRHYPSYVGMIRAIMGNPWPVYTTDDAPLSKAMTQGVVDALRKAGYSPLISDTRAADSRQDVMNTLKLSQADRMILITLNEWYSDLFRKGNYLTCYVGIEVFNRDGAALTERKIFAIEEDIGISETVEESEKVTLKAYQTRFESLLDHPEICRALQ